MMKPTKGKPLSLAVAGIVGLLSVTPLNAQSGGGLNLTVTSPDSGGGQSAGGTLVLTGTIGQHDASTQTLAGGSLRLAGGFWGRPGEPPPSDRIFSDGFEQARGVIQ